MIDKLNLLPWRELRRKQHKQRFVGLLMASVVVAMMGNGAIGEYIENQQSQQQSRNNQLQQELTNLEQRLAFLPKLDKQRHAIELRLKVIADIQLSRNRVTQLLNQLPEVVPAGVYLDGVNLAIQRVNVDGFGDTNGHLAALLGKAEQSLWFKNIEMHSLVTTKGADKQQKSQFNASFDLTVPVITKQPMKATFTTAIVEKTDD
ncbi:PilN domain-containing protein [Photobacterium carnosum]|jgi:type IV pilus assembly protein PilN|uniref:Pilus assembly protein PilS n=1 Tax=Photobacterium carnosum TaxID=2023717 RepID=A0A2N4UUE8_9GAMM|nr:PilN domain-containing protein [Photobacterium carnosum]KAE8176886.1 pilus assembly protein PilS [Photobacterium carnosum]MBY3788343.1 pilus assembly protein PilS [Photobacterium carnosum]MCD9494708.1 pilus assembly protein PilS [Photobacterium carnosum]MCD9499494.1 pilus assembly protein PilS [Photobacterium carnosum]MCD9514566.1 pilus assembly protein PilS [Photobacterium carnosum]